MLVLSLGLFVVGLAGYVVFAGLGIRYVFAHVGGLGILGRLCSAGRADRGFIPVIGDGPDVGSHGASDLYIIFRDGSGNWPPLKNMGKPWQFMKMDWNSYWWIG